MQPRFKRPESVLIVVYTSTQQVLLLRRIHPPDFWQSVTGSLEPNETPLQAARRELVEETGLDPKAIEDCHRSHTFPILPAWRHLYAPDVRENREHVFALQLEEPAPIRINPAEHSEYQWLDKALACEQASSSTNRQAILECVGPARS